MAYGARSNANLLPLRNICVTELILKSFANIAVLKMCYDKMIKGYFPRCSTLFVEKESEVGFVCATMWALFVRQSQVGFVLSREVYVVLSLDTGARRLHTVAGPRGVLQEKARPPRQG
jgi:hypothetical protein